MTLEAWVNPSTVNANWRDVIYKGNDNYYLEGTSSNASRPDAGLIAGGSYGDAYGTAALSANTWSYLAETYDGTTLRLYVNGTQVASTAHTGAITTSTNPLQIGGDSIYGQNFAGMIDEVRVYNTALTATQIQTDQTTPITPTGPDTTPPTNPSDADPDGGLLERDRPGLDRVDRQRRRHRLPDRTLPHLQLRTSPRSAPAPAPASKTPALSAGTGYSYRVRATDAAGNESGYSNTATATTQSPDTTPPTNPSALTPTVVSVERDRPGLDRVDRQRRRHRLPDRTLPQPPAAPSPRSAPAPAPASKTPG